MWRGGWDGRRGQRTGERHRGPARRRGASQRAKRPRAAARRRPWCRGGGDHAAQPAAAGEQAATLAEAGVGWGDALAEGPRLHGRGPQGGLKAGRDLVWPGRAGARQADCTGSVEGMACVPEWTMESEARGPGASPGQGGVPGGWEAPGFRRATQRRGISLGSCYRRPGLRTVERLDAGEAPTGS